MDVSGPGIELKAEFSGNLKIGDYTIQCAVLNNGKRVFWQREVLGLLTGSDKGNITRYFKAKNLLEYVPEKFQGEDWVQKILKFYAKTGQIANGFEAEDLIDICYMYINARNDGVLLPAQHNLAAKADIIVRAFAKTGVIAVIDEATGYQEIRKKEALQAILDKYLRKEFAAWAKTFPDEFYKQIFKLKGWPFEPGTVKRPSVIGKYTNEIVYQRLAPGILEELKARNPILNNGKRKAKHFQYLTEEIGHPALAQHLYAVIALMKASSNWQSFHKKLEAAFPVVGDQLFFDELLED